MGRGASRRGRARPEVRHDIRRPVGFDPGRQAAGLQAAGWVEHHRLSDGRHDAVCGQGCNGSGARTLSRSWHAGVWRGLSSLLLPADVAAPRAAQELQAPHASEAARGARAARFCHCRHLDRQAERRLRGREHQTHSGGEEHPSLCVPAPTPTRSRKPCSSPSPPSLSPRSPY